MVVYSENAKQEKSNLTLDHHLPHESSSKVIYTFYIIFMTCLELI